MSGSGMTQPAQARRMHQVQGAAESLAVPRSACRAMV